MNMPELTATKPGTLELLAQRIETEMGLQFSASNQRGLDGALRRMAESKGFSGQADCMRWLLDGPWDAARTQLCARFLTVGETYFFREPRALDLVRDCARQRIASGGAKAALRVWSAGCCTGEEPYSIAMTLRDQLPELPEESVSILATDLNAAFLDFARAGEYREWSFRRTPVQVRGSHFRPAGEGRFRIDQALRAQVRFAQLNLVTECYPSAATRTLAMDIIFCRNVLMYFSRPTMKAVIERFRACLVDGGWLVVNPSEASSDLFEGFTPVYFPDAVFFQKTAAALAQPKSAPAVRMSCRPRVATPSRLRACAPAAPVAAPAGAPAPDAAVSLQRLRRAAEASPLAAGVYQSTALAAIEQGDQQLARQSLKRLLYLEPDNALAHYLGALVEHAQGKRAAAVRMLEACDALLAMAGDADIVPGSDGWQSGSLRDSVRAWLERAR